MKKLIGLTLVLCLTGCASIADINAGFRKIDRVWQLEYQKTEDQYRYRVVDAPYNVVFKQVKKSFLDLEMPVQVSNIKQGIVSAENLAPHPLTQEEWLEVVKVEGPRVKELGGWMFRISEQPDEYIVTVVAAMKPVGDKTFVLLDYSLDMPSYTEMGLTPSEHAPPLAVQYGSLKFWNTLNSNLKANSLPTTRKRTTRERAAI